MRVLEVFRSTTFALYAVSIWAISYLVITNSQAHNNFSYLILVLPTLISLRFAEVRLFFSNRLSLSLLLIIVTLIISACVGDGDPWRQVKFGLIVLLFFVAIARLPVIPNEMAYRAAWIYLGLILLYIVLNIAWFYHIGSWVPGNRLGEMVAKLENAIYVTNTMGCMLAIITLIGIQKKKYRDVAIAHSLVLFFALIVLQTRSILIIWAIILLITYLAMSQEKNEHHLKHKTLLIWTMVIGVISIIFLMRFTNIGESLLARDFYRPEIWKGYIAETLRCGFWFGCGPDHNFVYISHDGNIMPHPHSIFVTQFYKAGLIGLAPLLVLAVNACILGYRQRSWAGWYFIAGVIGVCIDGSSLIHSPSQRWMVFHLPLALLIAQQLNQQYLNKETQH